MSTNTSRRGLLGAIAALPAAGLPVAVLARPATLSPDADLIALCADYVRCEREIWAVCGEEAASTAEEDAQHDRTAPLHQRGAAILDRIERATARTAESIHAMATALAVSLGEGGFSTEIDNGTDAARLLRTILRESLRLHDLPVAAFLLPQPESGAAADDPPTMAADRSADDDALLAACTELQKTIDETHALNVADECTDEQLNALGRRHHIALYRTMNLPALTPVGRLAKATAAYHEMVLAEDCHWGRSEYLAMSALADVVGADDLDFSES